MTKPLPRVTTLELDVALASNDELKTMLDHLLSKGYSGDAVEKVITEMTRRELRQRGTQ